MMPAPLSLVNVVTRHVHTWTTLKKRTLKSGIVIVIDFCEGCKKKKKRRITVRKKATGKVWRSDNGGKYAGVFRNARTLAVLPMVYHGHNTAPRG